MMLNGDLDWGQFWIVAGLVVADMAAKPFS
jgi:hypothetical protein